MKRVITPALIQALFTSWRADFQGGLALAETQYQKIAQVIPSTSRSNTYGTLGHAPTLREWIGDRVIKEMAVHGYQLENKSFESTVGVSRDDIEDDEIGAYTGMFEELGRAAGVKPDELVFQALKDGFINKCYDGQNFFDTDHPVYKDVNGQGDADHVSNIISESGYTGETCYILSTNRSIKPLIYQDRKKPELVSLTASDDEGVFMSKLLRYGVDMRAVAGYGFWQMAVAIKADLTSDSIWEGMKTMRSFKGDGGHRLAIRPTTLIVPPSMEDVATKLMEREFIIEDGTTVTNEVKGRLEVIVGDYL